MRFHLNISTTARYLWPAAMGAVVLGSLSPANSVSHSRRGEDSYSGQNPSFRGVCFLGNLSGSRDAPNVGSAHGRWLDDAAWFAARNHATLRAWAIPA